MRNIARSGGEAERGPEAPVFTIHPRQESKLAPCMVNCPNGADVRGWVAIVAQRDKLGYGKEEAYSRAWHRLVQRNPMPATMGRLCPHPCEADCNRSHKDGPVAINAMERFIGDWALAQQLPLPRLSTVAKGESIGVVGSGPAGLSFAYQMSRRGYPVVIYEQYSRLGGMLRYGIPRYRLPTEILEAEIERILDLGVEARTDTKVGVDLALEEIKSQHAILFAGMGAHKGLSLGVPGETGPGVWSGTSFLRQVSQSERVDLGRHVAVIGGGNTAVDAARTARRAGAQVTLLYRRGRAEMPAIEAEIEDALKEQVNFEFLAAPKAVIRNGNAVSGLLVQRMELGEPDSSGRRRPVAVPGSEFELPVSSVIAAVSQETDWRGMDPIKPEQDSDPDLWGRIGEGIWAGGDLLGLGIAVEAIAQGRHAAAAAHARLRGQRPPLTVAESAVGRDQIRADYYPERERLTVPEQPEDEWLTRPDREVRQTIAEADFLAEAGRCFSCGSCLGCEDCFMYCNAGAYSKMAQTAPGAYFDLQLEICVGCGKCIEVCPCGFLGPIADQQGSRFVASPSG